LELNVIPAIQWKSKIVLASTLCSCESAVYLIKYDSVHGTWDKEVVLLDDGSGFTVDGKLVTFT
jgi:glyceraldehyde 3-phosphate dehydrogenase